MLSVAERKTNVLDVNAHLQQDAAKHGVSSYTEWDPLEEVIVGVVEGADGGITGAAGGGRRPLSPTATPVLLPHL